jgi:hypothetical protein
MSIIITSCHETGRRKILINVDGCREFIHATDFEGWIIDITGDAEKPFIDSVRFMGCMIIADNMRAFNSCYFDDDCELLVRSLPKVSMGSQAQTINNNRVSLEA